TLANAFELRYQCQTKTQPHLFRSGRRSCEHTLAVAAEHCGERAVLEFTANARLDVMRIEPTRQCNAQAGMFERQEHGNVRERFGELLPEALGRARLTEQRDARVREKSRVAIEVRARSH